MNGKHVLIVEDDYLSNLELCEFLQESGYRVEPAYCAQAALAAIRRRPPWALLTDLDLGVGLTGFDVARFARSREAAMPVVYMSGDVGGRFPRESVDGSEFVAKPYRSEQILAALRAAARRCNPSGIGDLGRVRSARAGSTRPKDDTASWAPLLSLGAATAAFQPNWAH